MVGKWIAATTWQARAETGKNRRLPASVTKNIQPINSIIY